MGIVGTMRRTLGLRSGPRPPPSQQRDEGVLRIDRRRTFLDDDLQARFEDVGFVVVDLLDPSGVASLLDRFSAMDHLAPERYDWVEGFSTSIYDSRPDYRASVLDAIEEHVAPAFEPILDRYRIMFANFVVKEPHSDQVPPHVDWTFLDEERFSSVTVWCPLVDTTVENGTLGLVSGSHRRIDFLRAVNIPTIERCEAAVADIGERPIIELSAGQAIILDNRAVHFSPPNTTDQPRIAIGCVAGPVEADLHHYWKDEDDRLLRFQVERSFYLSYVIGTPPAEVDGVVTATLTSA